MKNVFIISLLSIAIFLIAGADVAFAQCNPACNDCGSFATPICSVVDGQAQGLCIISRVVSQINQVLDGAAATFFEGIRQSGLNTIFSAMLTLYIAIYGIMFMIGAVQVSGWDVFVRLFKIALISIIISDAGFDFFRDYIGAFFREGIDGLIAESTRIMVQSLGQITFLSDGSINNQGYVIENYGGATNNVFMPIDVLLGQVISPRSLAVISAALTASPGGWGLSYLGIFVFAMIFLIAAIAKAVWIYLMSLLVTAFLFGLAPVFFLFLLFNRTQNIFQKWLDMIVNFSLQPLFVLVFFGLFAEIMRQGMTSMLNIPACLTFTEAGQGNPNGQYQWTFATLQNGVATAVQCITTSTGISGQPGTESEALCAQLNTMISDNFVELLIFMLLAYICWNFFSFATNLAQSITGTFINLDNIRGFLHGLGDSAIGSAKQSIGQAIGQQILPSPPQPNQQKTP